MLAEILQKLLPYHAKLIAISKTQSPDKVLGLYREGQRRFGENKVQELAEKYEQLPKDIEWHLVGHLQTNKVKYIAGFVHCVQSVDSLKLILELEKQAAKYQRDIRVLLQFKIAKETSKFGLDWEEAVTITRHVQSNKGSRVIIAGVMGMATLSLEESIIRSEFKLLKNYFDRLKAEYFVQDESFKDISMGMSDDFEIALQEGSTMVRIGTLLFGAR